MAQPTHYEILSLPKTLLEDASSDQATQIIKRAYHRALLQHHPDKALSPPTPSTASAPPRPNQNDDAFSRSNTTKPIYTIDQIITAYTILSTPSTKKTYDQSLQTANHPGTTTFQTGIETIDLDDLSSSTTSTTSEETFWWKSCRCGNPQGFRFGEADLEEAGDLGELIVGCQDCSLWLRVHFAVVEEDGGEN